MHRSLSRRVFGCRLAVLVGIVTGWMATAHGASSSQVTLPAGKFPVSSGLVINLDASWVDGNGYRPIRLEVKPVIAPSKADRRIRVEVQANNIYGGAQKTYVRHIDIPEGSVGVTETLLVHQCDPFYSIEISCFEDGYQWEDLSYNGPLGPAVWGRTTEAVPTVLFIDRDVPGRSQRATAVRQMQTTGITGTPTYTLPDFRNLAAAIGVEVQTVTTAGSDAELLLRADSLSRLELLPHTELPNEWLAYSCFDLVFVSLEDLELLVDKYPDQARALREWNATGTVLVVYGVGSEFEKLERVEQLLTLPPLTTDGSQTKHRGWTAPAQKLFGEEFAKDRVEATRQLFQQNGMLVATTASPTTPPAQPAPPQTSRDEQIAAARFVTRPLGLGRVAAFASDNPFPGSPSQWNWLFHSIDGSSNTKRLNWTERHGMSLQRHNRDFWEWLIPGVGFPPVILFLVLITVFVLVIGPVNYLVLVHRRRLYLLLVTVPLGATLATLGLLAWAILTDGLGVKARVRSHVHIDQASGNAVSWSRQTYYSSIAPTRGMSFPTNAAVFPLEDRPPQPYERRSGRYRVEWDEQQHLVRGYLKSRTMGQFLVVQSGPTTAFLGIQEQAGGNPPKIDNRLGGTIRYLVIRDSTGQLFSGEEIAPEATAELRPVLPEEALDRWQGYYADNAPQVPPGFDFRSYEEALSYSRRNWWGYDSDVQLPPPRLETSILECANPTVDRDALLPPRSYHCVVSETPYVPLGIKPVEETSSFHVISGTW